MRLSGLPPTLRRLGRPPHDRLLHPLPVKDIQCAQASLVLAKIDLALRRECGPPLLVRVAREDRPDPALPLPDSRNAPVVAQVRRRLAVRDPEPLARERFLRRSLESLFTHANLRPLGDGR